MENVDAPAAPEEGDVPELTGHNGVVNEFALVFRRELRAQGILYREAVFASLEEG